MLIYNFQKELIGIDEKDLKILGFNNLEELLGESADIADMFVKAPGFIHNFQHIHWIDFAACAESIEDSKVIIHAKGQNYKCNLDIKIVYLVDNPSHKAYLIKLINLRTISDKEITEMAKNVEKKPASQTTVAKKALFDGQDLNKEVDSKSDKLDIEEQPINNEIVVEKTVKEEEFPSVEPTLNNDFKIDLEIDEEVVPAVQKAPKPVKKIPIPIKEEVVEPENIYIYNPQLASDELGLPTELIEEFLEDFIVQADEFKDKIYKALEEENISEAKSLSHKLKGVAANLRIEDALEVLTIANTSDDFHKIKTSIDKFYEIMSRFSIAKDSDKIVEISDATEDREENDDHDYDENLFITFEDEKTSNTAEEILEPIDDVIQYDKNLIAQEIGINRKFFDELFSDFINDASILVDSANKAIKNNSSDIWKDSAHTLKGMSGNMRINQFTQEIETLLNTDDTKDAKDAIDGISSKLKKISKI